MATKFLPLVIGLAITPFFFITVALLNIFRLLGHLALKNTDSYYVCLLDTLEAFFDRERGGSFSVLNVFCRVRLTTDNNLRNVVIALAEKTASNPKNVKMRCIIERRFGLSYWRLASVDFEKQIRWFDASNENELQSYLCRIANVQINDKMMWEVHVNRLPIDGHHSIIARFHHSMGDGFALREMAVEAEPGFKPLTQSGGKCFTFIDSFEAVRNHLFLMCDVFKLLVFAPELCIEQYLSRKDTNSLREDVLSGGKILRWKKGDFSKVKTIQKFTGSSTTEIVMCAISQGLDDLFKSRGETVDRVTITYPTRLSSAASNGLANEFLPVSLKLPVSTPSRERDVGAAVASLRNTPAYQCNFQLPRIVAALWPVEMPDWAYEATEATCLFSNFPGPKRKLVFDGFDIEDFCFFLPNLHKNNGLGITVTSYVDNFNFAVILDEKLSRHEDDAQKLVDRIVSYIDEVYSNI